MRNAALLAALLLTLPGAAQYPLTRTFELRIGTQRPHIDLLTQDDQGLLWAATDQGLLRSDGERTDLVWNAGGDAVTALQADGHRVLAATAEGWLLSCTGYRCDTMGQDTTLRTAPVRALLAGPDGTLWIGTYGAGVLLRSEKGTTRITVAQGLGDDHVNALCAIGRGRIAAATDQGISLCGADGKVQARIGEEQGAPDNLVLSLAAGENGHFWAGTDRSGVFRFDPDRDGYDIQVWDTAWAEGAVRSLAASRGSVWAGSGRNGVVVLETRRGLGSYRATRAADAPLARITDIMHATDGSVWWCDGSETVTRADPDVLVVAGHEGIDLRHISALCTDGGSLWSATPQGVFRHDVVFADRSRLFHAELPVDPERPVVALEVAADGSLWAGTFGNGVFRRSPDGRVRHFGPADGLCNDNVLAIHKRGPELWFATLGGVCVFRPDTARPGEGAFHRVPIPGSGFVYDVRPLADGTTLVATDGNGLIRIDAQGHATALDGKDAPSTYYSLGLDEHGAPWACGPGTGICRVAADGVHCSLRGRPPFDGDVYAIASHEGRLLVLGKNGLASFDPATQRLLDLGEEFGLAGAEAELNTVCTDDQGALWLACDRGLVRITSSAAMLDGDLRAHITALDWGDQGLPLDSAITLRHDQNFLTFRFAAPHYAAPGQVRFTYRLVGLDPTLRATRDREITFSRLPPGDYRFELKASLGEDTGNDRWTGLSFTIAPPWWRRPWAIGLAVLLLSALFYLFIRSREERMRYRDRVEKERTRFQLEALRSQVNPHFLFNSFNTLIGLIEQDRAKAVEHVEHLSDFFREILSVRDQATIPLNEELRLVRTYFYLEQRRFEERIALRIKVPETQLWLHLPPLTVQLLVENALKHNVATIEEPLVVEVLAEGGELEVVNDFRPRVEAPRSTGFGIESIRRHYAALTDRPVIVSQAEGRFRVRIPLLPTP